VIDEAHEVLTDQFATGKIRENFWLIYQIYNSLHLSTQKNICVVCKRNAIPYDVSIHIIRVLANEYNRIRSQFNAAKKFLEIWEVDYESEGTIGDLYEEYASYLIPELQY
jgi:hypothetical protein